MRASPWEDARPTFWYDEQPARASGYMNALLNHITCLMAGPNAAWFFPLYFLGLYALVMAALSYSGGWGWIGREYRAGGEPTGETYFWRNLRAGPTWLGKLGYYKRCINATLCYQGVYLTPILLFRLFHPPLFLPWTLVGAPRFGDESPDSVYLPIRAGSFELELELPRGAESWCEAPGVR